MAGLRHVYCVFQKDHRVVVCKCNGPATALHCRVCNRLGRGQILDPVKALGFGDVPVLAELARQVTARGAK